MGPKPGVGRNLGAGMGLTRLGFGLVSVPRAPAYVATPIWGGHKARPERRRRTLSLGSTASSSAGGTGVRQNPSSVSPIPGGLWADPPPALRTSALSL